METRATCDERRRWGPDPSLAHWGTKSGSRLTLQRLTNGAYEPEAGLFRSATGQVEHYESTDHVEHPSDARLTTDDFLDLLAEHTLARDHECEAGSVFHLASAIAGMGIAGSTAVGDTAAEADAVFERARAALDAESAGLAR